MGLGSIGRQMSWGEVARHIKTLASDPSSHVAAAIGGWQYPASRADLTLRDLYDLQHQSKAKRRPKAYIRPWDAAPKRHGSASMSIAEFEAMKAEISQLGEVN